MLRLVVAGHTTIYETAHLIGYKDEDRGFSSGTFFDNLVYSSPNQYYGSFERRITCGEYGPAGNVPDPWTPLYIQRQLTVAVEASEELPNHVIRGVVDNSESLALTSPDQYDPLVALQCVGRIAQGAGVAAAMRLDARYSSGQDNRERFSIRHFHADPRSREATLEVKVHLYEERDVVDWGEDDGPRLFALELELRGLEDGARDKSDLSGGRLFAPEQWPRVLALAAWE